MEYILFGVLAVQKVSFSEHVTVVQCSVGALNLYQYLPIVQLIFPGLLG